MTTEDVQQHGHGQTSTTGESTSKSPFMLDSASSIEEKFPMWVNIFQHSEPYPLIQSALLILFFYQILIISAWPWQPYWQKEKNNELMKLLKYIAFWKSEDSQDYHYALIIGILFALNAFSLVITKIQTLYYKYQRKFINTFNTPFKFYFDAFTVAVIFVNLVATGEVFLKLATGSRSAILIISFLMGMLNELYLLSCFIIVQHLESASLFLKQSVLLSFDSTHIVVLTICLHVVTILYFILYYFENWSTLIAIAANCGVYFYIIYKVLRDIFFVHSFINCTALGFSCGNIFANIMMIIAHFSPQIKYKTIIHGAPFVIVVFTIISSIFLFIRIHKIKKSLNLTFTDQEKANEYYDELQLDKSEAKALLYLRLSFVYACPCFYDMTLINYIAAHYQTERALSLCILCIAFFPNETRLQNRFEKQLKQSRKLHYKSKFLLFQTAMIRSLRHFTESTQTKLKLLELKNLTRQSEVLAKFGIDGDFDYRYLEHLASMCSRTRALWNEALNNFPNSAKMCEEYTKYLLEVECDFHEAILIKNKQMLIESGKYNVSDQCFTSFVKIFPKYLTSKIIDTRGKIIKSVVIDKNNNKPQIGDSSKNSTGSSRIIHESEEVELDSDTEEYIARNIMRMPRTRLALHRLLENRLPFSIKMIKYVTIFIIFYLLAASLAVYLVYIHLIGHHIHEMTHLRFLANTRYYIALSNVCIFSQYFKENEKISYYLGKFSEFMKVSVHTNPVINFQVDNFAEQILKFSTIASSNFSTLLSHISDVEDRGSSFDEMLKILFMPSAILTTFEYSCYKSFTANTSLASIIALSISNQRRISGMPQLRRLNFEPDACEIANNFMSLLTQSSILYDDFSTNQKDDAEYIKFVLKVAAITIIIVTLTGIFIPTIVIHFMTVKDQKKLRTIIKSFSLDAKNEAKESISVEKRDDTMSYGDMLKRASKNAILLFSLTVWAVCYIGVIMISVISAYGTTNNLIKLDEWNEHAASRLSLSSESLNALMNIIIMKEVSGTYDSVEIQTQFIHLTYYLLQLLTTADFELINGTNTSSPCLYFDAILDELNIKNEEMPDDVENQPEYYQYLSIHNMLSIYDRYVTNIITNMMLHKDFDKEEAANAMFLMNYHMFHKIANCSNRIIELSDVQWSNMQRQSIIISSLIFTGLMIYCILQYMYFHSIASSYRAALFVIKRFNPYALLNNKEFSRVFLKEKDSLYGEKLTLEASIIKNAHEAIFLTNAYGIVEVTNYAVNSLLGYNPEQILGQPITTFLCENDIDEVKNKMEMMRNKQISLYSEANYAMLDDCSTCIPVNCSMIGMNYNSDTVNSFVFIMRNVQSLLDRKKEAEVEKAKSEKLLYQIMPRDIVVRINNGESDISFSVPFATIIFIDINKFSEYSSNLSPQDIMSNLSFYFAEIDRIASKYEMLNKIKLIGDIYMAACGLFHPNIEPIHHAEDTIKFALEVVDEIDNINRCLESHLSIRIGVNSGGPVIAGILGSDKPLFDIIGDPINIAARLQSTGGPNQVHISQATYDLLKDTDFYIAKVGDTFLKGKGVQTTYIVSNPIFCRVNMKKKD